MSRLNLSEWALDHRSFVVYLMTAFLVAGGYSYLNLGRDEDPPIPLKIMVLNVKWPGSTLQEMMLQVTDRIEKKLQEVPFLDFIKSESKPGDATIYIYLKESTPRATVASVWYQVRKKLIDIASTMPDGVLGPFFDDEFGDTFSLIYAFTADGFTSRELRDYVTVVRSSLLGVSNTLKINVIGAQDEKVYIEFDIKQLTGLGIDRVQAIDSLRQQNMVAPAGVVTSSSEHVLLRVSGGFASDSSLRDVNLYVNGRFYRLTDIAKIRRGYADPPQPGFRFNGEPAIGLAIAMSSGADVLQFGKDVRRKIAEVVADLPVGIEPHLVADQPFVVKNAVAGFMEALWMAIGIILAISFVSLGMRAGMVVALSIPLVLAIVFTGMEFSNIALHRISLGALVIALGLLVDDAMITIEMMVRRLELGFDPRAAATHAYFVTAFPMLTGTLVTIAGFVPVGFARSDSGEYLLSLFVVVALALIVSWVVAVLFAPLLGALILPQSLSRVEAAREVPGRFGRGFRRMLISCLRHKYAVILATLASFGGAIYGATMIEQQFFPSSDRPELLVELRLPQSAPIYQTQAFVERLEKLMAGDPNIERYTTYVGEGAPRFYLTLNVALPNDFVAQAVIVTKGLRERDAVRRKLKEALAEQLPEALGRVEPLELGPIIEWPLQYRISGPDVQRLRRLAYDLANIVGSNPDARNVNFDWIEPVRAMHIRVDQAKAHQVGLSSADIAQALNATASGLSITQLRDSVYLVDVVARAVARDRSSLEAVRSSWIQLKEGHSIPLSDIASFEYVLEQPEVWRRDGRPTITVQAEVGPGSQPETVHQRLAPLLSRFAAALPAGYALAPGGTVEASDKSLDSVLAVIPAMLFLMLTVLMAQLQSFRQLFLVISVAPLGLIGVVAVMLPTHTPMGFVALLGLIALTGMIIRNSVILVDQISKNRAAGESAWDAVVNATVHRFRPILLTAAAAILGMLPIARDVFWGPMAYTIIGGLGGATLLTLIFVPALYVAAFRITEPVPAESSG